MRACKNCINSRMKQLPNTGGGMTPVRECHRDPPTVCAGPQGVQAAWPVVEDDAFCGSFEPSGESALAKPEQVTASAVTRPPVDPALRPSEAADKVVGG